jgi:hypothetical protein
MSAMMRGMIRLHVALLLFAATSVASAETHRFVPTAGVQTYARRQPVLRVKPGDIVETETFSKPGELHRYRKVPEAIVAGALNVRVHRSSRDRRCAHGGGELFVHREFRRSRGSSFIHREIRRTESFFECVHRSLEYEVSAFPSWASPSPALMCHRTVTGLLNGDDGPESRSREDKNIRNSAWVKIAAGTTGHNGDRITRQA